MPGVPDCAALVVLLLYFNQERWSVMSESVVKEQAGVTYPALALRGLVVFPKMLLQFDVGRKKPCWLLKKPWKAIS